MTALGLRPRFRLGLSSRTTTSTVFSPAAVGGLAFWYDAALSPVVESGGAVERWDDLSGNANHAGQSTLGQRPLKAADAQGREHLRFDGTDDVLSVTAPPDFSGGVTVFVAYRVHTPGSFERILAASAAESVDNADFFAFQYEQAADREVQLLRNTTEPAIVKGVDSGELQFAIFTLEDDRVLLRDLSGEASNTGTATPLGTPAVISLGAGWNGEETFSYGGVDLYEVGLYDRVLSPAELDRLEGWLRGRRGLAWTPLHLGADLAWYHDVDTSAFTLAGGLVDQWDDSAGAGRHWVQSGAARPTRTTDASGHDVVRFDGVDDVMEMAGTLPSLDPFTVAVVYAVRDRADFEGVLSAAAASGTDHAEFWTFQLASAASGDMQLHGRSSEGDPGWLLMTRPDGGSAQIAIWTVDGGTGELRDASGSVSDTYAGGFGAPAHLFLGGRYTGAPDLFADVDVYATVGVARPLSPGDQQKLIDWAAARWGV